MRFVSLAMVLIAVTLSLVFYPTLPDPMPTHWNFSGEVDGWSSKMLGAFLMPLLMVGMVALFAVLPRISPRGYPVDAQSRGYRAIELATVAFLLGIHLVILLSATGTAINMTVIVPMLVGALFVVLGNYMSKMRRNFFIGIRTPWTLADEDVWYRTHRLGGRVFVAAGLALMIVPFAGEAQHAAFTTIAIAAAFIPIVYSYVIYRRLHLNNGGAE
ncbi:MAG TPA: SdpI family protein [Thermoanaerobaculia bacterium]|nr:SdpI family protein [Thermoanaerobaculia bacterium]